MDEKQVLIAIPVHKFDVEVAKYLSLAVASVENQNIGGISCIIVCPNGIVDSLKDSFDGVEIVGHDGDTGFESQVNVAFEHAISNNYVWVGILEFDDSYDPKYVETLLRHANHKNVSYIAPFSLYVDEESKYIGIHNEACWARNIVEQSGSYDIGSLFQRNFLLFTSCLIKTESVKDFGGMKEIPLTHTHEFILRMAYNGVECSVVPHILHTHTFNRSGSYLDGLVGNITKEEFNFWNDVARKEYFFVEDRHIEYKPEEKEE